MSLRNKKTGEISTNPLISVAPYTNNVRGCHIKTYQSIAELNNEWEDAEDIDVPSMPLIKDKKIRKAVRAWADGNECINVQFDAYWRGFRHNDSTITIWDDLPLKDGAIYSIAELCGEEEAPEPIEPTFIDLDGRVKEKGGE